MDFKELEKKTIGHAMDYSKRNSVKIDKDFALLKLYEEIGELTKNVLIHERKCRPEKYLSEEKSKKELAKEFADVLGVLIVVAHLFNIDLEKAISKKWINKKRKNNRNLGPSLSR